MSKYVITVSAQLTLIYCLYTGTFENVIVSLGLWMRCRSMTN